METDGDLPILIVRQFDPASAHGTTTLLRSGTGKHHRLPDVARGTLPPDPLVAAGSDHLRSQNAVELRMPLGGQLRVGRGKVVEPRQHLAVGAVRTVAGLLHPGGDHRAVLVALPTLPPDPAVAAWRDLRRCERAVFRRVPLGRNVRVPGQQVVFPPHDLLARANRSAVFAHSAGANG